MELGRKTKLNGSALAGCKEVLWAVLTAGGLWLYFVLMALI